MKVVIIGGGTAGLATATKLRRLDENAEIVILEKSAEFAVSNCALPYYLSGQIARHENLIGISAEGLKKPLPMQADQRLVFDTETGKIRISTVSADDYCSWTADHLVFANKPLSEILVNLENWYNVRFRYEKDTDLSEKLSFHLKYEPLEETMHILSRIARIEYEIRGNEVFLVPAR